MRLAKQTHENWWSTDEWYANVIRLQAPSLALGCTWWICLSYNLGQYCRRAFETCHTSSCSSSAIVPSVLYDLGQKLALAPKKTTIDTSQLWDEFRLDYDKWLSNRMECTSIAVFQPLLRWWLCIYPIVVLDLGKEAATEFSQTEATS